MNKPLFKNGKIRLKILLDLDKNIFRTLFVYFIDYNFKKQKGYK
jgi:hypothetical protein